MTANPNKLAAASAFDSFKNYGSFTGSVSISGTVGASTPTNFVTFSTSFDLERTDIATQIYMESDLDPGKSISLVGQYFPKRTGTITGPVSVPYNILFTFTFTGTTMTVQAAVTNPYGLTLTLQSENITFTVKTFIGPFTG